MAVTWESSHRQKWSETLERQEQMVAESEEISSMSGYAAIADQPERPSEEEPFVKPQRSLARRLTELLQKEGPRFTQGPAFGYLISVLISANIVLLAAETDHPDVPVWCFCDFLFLVAFVAEIVYTVHFLGDTLYLPESLQDRQWIMFDSALVVAGVLEVSVPLLQDDYVSSLWFLWLRLVRLLRLLKFFKFSKRIAALAMALLDMIEPFTLIFGVVFLFILAGAIICTQLLGHMSDSSSEEFTREEIQGLQDSFGSVSTSMFSLFQVTTLDNWMEVAGPAAARHRGWQIFFVVFISFGSWTMISILTAVASDSMVAAASDREEIEAREREALRENFLNFLRDAFLEADADGNGVMDRGEFEALIKKDSVINYMSGQGVGVTVADLKKAWETLDASAGRTGELTIDEFVAGFLTLSKGISTHDIATVDYGLRKTSGQAAHRIKRLTKIVKDVRTYNEEVIAALQKNYKMQNEQLECLSIWRDWASKQDPQLYAKAVVQAAEEISSGQPEIEVSDCPS